MDVTLDIQIAVFTILVTSSLHNYVHQNNEREIFKIFF